MIDAYTSILMEARRAILSERGNNPIANGIAHDLTQIINAITNQEKRITANEGLYCL